MLVFLFSLKTVADVRKEQSFKNLVLFCELVLKKKYFHHPGVQLFISVVVI
jgi:hypothetical protein